MESFPYTPFIQHDRASYSIRKEFCGATVLVTGGTGYIGSLVVEQLLRTTDVGKIYMLVRGKRGQPAQDRINRLLHTGLFHMVRDSPELLAKVEVAEGDMESDNLGLSPATHEKLLSQVNIVIHSAASIGLEADVQQTLHCNYVGTSRLLKLAGDMQQLRCFVHVSTAYVNMNLGKGVTVDELLYPLKIGKQTAHYQDIVDDLLSIEPAAANVRAQMYMDMWGFPNTYTLGKNLTEKLVAAHYQAGLPVAIVRPSLVCGLAGAPYPGYCGNLAGPVGMGVAMAVGLFDSLESVAMVPTHVWDAVPGDVVSSVILAAAAATAANVRINEYKEEAPASVKDPMIVHAGTSTTYPISMVEANRASVDFVLDNPAPYKLPGCKAFHVPLDYVPDEAAVKRRKYWTSWKVWLVVWLLELIGQKKVAHRLKYGFMAWEVMNSTKTDVNIFFSSRNLQKLEASLDKEDAETGLFSITWTLKNGGWTRYIITNLAGMYKHVFGITNLKGLKYNDFKFIPNKPVPKASAAAVAVAAESSSQEVAAAAPQEVELGAKTSTTDASSEHLPQLEGSSHGSHGSDSESSHSNGNSVIVTSYSAAAAAFSHTPADRFSLEAGGKPGQQQQHGLEGSHSYKLTAAAAAAAGAVGGSMDGIGLIQRSHSIGRPVGTAVIELGRDTGHAVVRKDTAGSTSSARATGTSLLRKDSAGAVVGRRDSAGSDVLPQRDSDTSGKVGMLKHVWSRGKKAVAGKEAPLTTAAETQVLQ